MGQFHRILPNFIPAYTIHCSRKNDSLIKVFCKRKRKKRKIQLVVINRQNNYVRLQMLDLHDVKRLIVIRCLDLFRRFYLKQRDQETGS